MDETYLFFMPTATIKTTDSQPPARRPGRPRGDEARVAILEAAYALLEESGLVGFTIEGVAARAGAAKTTIYRWWPTRESLAVAAFLSVALPRISFSSTGSAANAIRSQMLRLVTVYSGKTGRVVRDLVAAGNSDPLAAAAFVESYVRQRRQAVREVLQRGIDAGEFRPDIDFEAAIDALYGPVFYRLLVGHGTLDKTWTKNVADIVLAGLTPDAPKRANESGSRTGNKAAAPRLSRGA